MRATWAKGCRGLALAGLLFGGGSSRCAAQQESTETSKTSKAEDQFPAAPLIVGVRIVREDGTVLKEEPAGLPIEAGKPLDREQVATSLRLLYKTGDYSNLSAVATPVDGGVRLDFIVKENLYFNQLVLRG